MNETRRPVRGTLRNPPCRYHQVHVAPDATAGMPGRRTRLEVERARSILTRNRSPDVPFDRSVNPYRGCEHGCIYCYARPGHAWVDLSPGLDFETRLFCKPDAPRLLREALSRPGYRPAPLALGTATDAWQPVEKTQRITRGLLEVLAECGHPVCMVTKSALIERDLDLLAPMARRGLARCAVSLTTLEKPLSRRMEPRAAAPARRLETIRRLADAGVPVTVLVAPVIPGLTDHELEAILAAARRAGAASARMVVLRLPGEVEALFRGWLEEHFPARAERVMGLARALHGGRAEGGPPGQRMTGSGPLARLLADRFRLAVRRLGYGPVPGLRTDRFRPPRPEEDGQLELPGLEPELSAEGRP